MISFHFDDVLWCAQSGRACARKAAHIIAHAVGACVLASTSPLQFWSMCTIWIFLLSRIAWRYRRARQMRALVCVRVIAPFTNHLRAAVFMRLCSHRYVYAIARVCDHAYARTLLSRAYQPASSMRACARARDFVRVYACCDLRTTRCVGYLSRRCARAE